MQPERQPVSKKNDKIRKVDDSFVLKTSGAAPGVPTSSPSGYPGPWQTGYSKSAISLYPSVQLEKEPIENHF